MGLESQDVDIDFLDVEFAPCMGLERIQRIRRTSQVLFAPCMGLESIAGSSVNYNYKFAPCMGLERSFIIFLM